MCVLCKFYNQHRFHKFDLMSKVAAKYCSSVAEKLVKLDQIEKELDTAAKKMFNMVEEINSNARKDERYLFVREWLVKFIPHLHEEDVAAYSNRLINDGFDCAESFRELHAEDLDFMKVAHRRAVVRALFS